MKKTILSIGIAALMLGAASCSKKLDIPQHGVTGIEDYYKTDQEANEAVSAIHYQWAYLYNNLFFTYVTDFPSDDMYAGGKARGANTAIEGLSDFTFDESNARMLDAFTTFYQMVYRSNAIIEYFPEPASAIQKEAVAEAHFFRAWCYFYLTALWGTPPIADHILKPSEYLQPNATQEALYALMESDLTTAINSGALAEKSGVNDQVVRITKQAAQAMLGKVYVWQKKWSEANKIFGEVISSGKYELFKGDYCEILNSSTDYNCENILEANIIRDDSNRVSGMVSVSIGWRGELFTWNGCDLDVATTGFGQACPTRDLYDAFVEMEGPDGYRLNNTLLTYAQLNEHHVFLKPGVSYDQNAGIFAYKARYSIKDKNGTNATSHNNPRYMRLAEVLLLAAESELMGGDASKAATYVNRVRERAKLSPLPAVTLDDIKKEKRLELCYEGVRFLDLQRWGDAARLLKDKGRKIPALLSDGTVDPAKYTYDYGGYQVGKHEYFPFPKKEMNVNTKLTQNPGWGE